MKAKLTPYQDQTIVVALSGGLDSTVLLHALADIIPRERLRAIHIHHGLSPNANHWQTHCISLCKSLGVALTTLQVQGRPAQGESIEAWARDQRYTLLEQHLQDGELLMTAQHADDQAETVLLALLRGSGPKGLAAMPLIKPFGKGFHVRPLLELSRNILEDYAHEHQLSWVHDESNDDHSYDRNFLRHAVTPVLEQRWPSLAQTLVRVASHCAEQEKVLEALLAPLWPSMLGSQPGTLSITELTKQDVLVQKALIRGWLEHGGHSMPGHKMLDEILHTLIPAAEDARPQVNWGEVSVRRYRDDLYALRPQETQSLKDICIEWEGTHPLTLPLGAGVISPDPGLGSCTIRFDQQGLGLKKTFQELGIPPWQRARIPLIYKDGAFLCHILVYKSQ
jgi:tRNA(Ile)-lysidine synthase